MSNSATSTSIVLENYFLNSTATMESSPYMDNGLVDWMVATSAPKTAATFSTNAALSIVARSSKFVAAFNCADGEFETFVPDELLLPRSWFEYRFRKRDRVCQ